MDVVMEDLVPKYLMTDLNEDSYQITEMQSLIKTYEIKIGLI